MKRTARMKLEPIINPSANPTFTYRSPVNRTVPLLCLEGIKVIKSPTPTPRVRVSPQASPPMDRETVKRFFIDSRTNLNEGMTDEDTGTFGPISGPVSNK